jgi:hypothetical protein
MHDSLIKLDALRLDIKTWVVGLKTPDTLHSPRSFHICPLEAAP